MAVPSFTMRQLLESGVHFGHHRRRWNPQMKSFIFGTRNGTHIIDLDKTYPMLHKALSALHNVAASGGRVLFVGTKRQAADAIAEAAERCGQFYVNHRWLGGMMTNWSTITKSISRLKELKELLGEENTGLTKKETLQLTREYEKLERSLGGIKDLGGVPDILFVIDTNKESIAILEAKKLGIPVVAIVDTNASFENIDYPVPGNDDAIRSINLYCDLAARSILEGMQEELIASGVDIGASESLSMDLDDGEAAEETEVSEPKAAKGSQKAQSVSSAEAADDSVAVDA